MKEIIERIIKEYSINRPNYDVTILREDIDNMSDDIVREINRYIELMEISAWRTYKPEDFFQLIDTKINQRLV